MGIEGLGYIGVRAKDLGDWATYGTNFLGLQRIDRSRSSLAFRMDDRKQRLVVDADAREQPLDILEQEVSVLEKSQHAEVDRYAGNQP